MNEIILDKIGQEIKVGSWIAYGHSLSRSAGLRIGKVLNMKYNEDKWNLTRKHLAITVMGVDDDWAYLGNPNNNQPKLNERKGTLLFPERIIVIHESKIPDSYKKLFGEKL